MKKTLSEILNTRLSLSEFLSYIYFDYGIDEDNMIYLIDKEEVYLGDINEDRFTNSDGGKIDVINRLDHYWYDSIINDVQEQLDSLEIYNGRYEYLETYEEYLDFLKSIYNECDGMFHDDILLLNLICNPSMIYLNDRVIELSDITIKSPLQKEVDRISKRFTHECEDRDMSEEYVIVQMTDMPEQDITVSYDEIVETLKKI